MVSQIYVNFLFLICSEFDGYHMMLQKPPSFYVHGCFFYLNFSNLGCAGVPV